MTFFTIISLLLSCSTSSTCVDDHQAVVAFAAERFGMRVKTCEDTKHFCNSFQEVRDLCPVTCGQCFRRLPPAVCEDNDAKAAALMSHNRFKGISTCAEAKQWCFLDTFYSICPMTCGICSNASDRHFMMMNTFMTSPKSEHQSSEIDLKGYISTGELTTNAVVNANEANEKYPVSCTENCCKDCRIGLDSRSWPSATDMWGWEAADGTQLAVVGLTDRTAIVDVTYDSNPRLLGYMPQLAEHIIWKDVKIWDSLAFICSEAPGFGLQYIDLKKVLKFDAFPRVFQQEFLHTDDSYTCHNLIMNRDTPVLYTAGSSSCKSIARIPLKFNADGTLQQDVQMMECIDTVFPQLQVHDAQCVIYDGPDQRFLGEEICFLSTALGRSVAVYSWTQKKTFARSSI
jgi:choice-of-anchor B domain-containing protein